MFENIKLIFIYANEENINITKIMFSFLIRVPPVKAEIFSKQRETHVCSLIQVTICHIIC